MIPTRNSTSAISVASRLRTSWRLHGGPRAALVAVTLLAYLLRVLRLEWQPLWWDEGYSVFFATESLAEMLSLTAQDIHPPLYYALLRFWILLFDSARPAVDRLLSVYTGVLAVPLLAILAYALTRRAPVAVFSALLLAINPLHVYYSQEVRMYSLALLLGLLSTYTLYKWRETAEVEPPQRLRLAAYIVSAALLVHTLYYGAFVISAQFTWLAWRTRRHPPDRRTVLTVVGLLVLLCLPWMAYTVPKLVYYIGDKVQSDQDAPVSLLQYVVRHLLAFTAGHVQLDHAVFRAFAYLGLVAVIPLAVTARVQRHTLPSQTNGLPDQISVLWLLVSVPALLAFLLNLRFPFFPQGGERLLLVILPYFLLLITLGIVEAQPARWVRRAMATALVLSALSGLTAYYSVPRYVEDDYRPIIAQVMRQGSDDDTVLALFPWQVGYWRAYSPSAADGGLLSPQPEPVGQQALVWDSRMQARIDEALDGGVLWFPAPVSFGSTLPIEIESYLTDAALNVENRWHGASTRLTAWAKRPPDMRLAPVDSDVDSPAPDAASIAPNVAAADNAVISVALHWPEGFQTNDRHVAVRLLDDQGREWLGRDYEPPGRFSGAEQPSTDLFGLLIPPGIPPGGYTLAAGVVAATGESPAEAPAHMVQLAHLRIVNPATPVSVHRLPIDCPARGSEQVGPLQLRGAAHLDADQTYLAGTFLDFSLALQKTGESQAEVVLSANLLDRNGATVAGWEGWPLPDYPASAWPVDGLALAPVSLYLPADLSAGRYTLSASVIDGAQPALRSPQRLAEIAVISRPAVLAQPQPGHLMPAPVQFGTHALLYGYDLDMNGDLLRLTLYWEALHTLLPPHHIFVHIVAPSGEIAAQNDGAPVTAVGPAPTGSWRAGEFIVSEHAIRLPTEVLAENGVTEVVLRVGLYEPKSEVRLPAFVDGQPEGDNVEIAAIP